MTNEAKETESIDMENVKNSGVMRKKNYLYKHSTQKHVPLLPEPSHRCPHTGLKTFLPYEIVLEQI